MTMKLLDCFCGMGGVSDGFALEGFDVTGIDIVDAPKILGYKHRFIQADMETLKGEDFRGYDVIWGSPPCRDFSNLAIMGKGSIRKNGTLMKWKIPPNPMRGLKLVYAFLIFVEEARTKFWILENVANLALYLKRKPKVMNAKIWGGKRHVFYGNFPPFLLPIQDRKIMHTSMKGRYKSWQRAKIPLSCSQAFAKACKEALLEVQVS
jgi:DNA (cytosine-5)-methyltransferase 1